MKIDSIIIFIPSFKEIKNNYKKEIELNKYNNNNSFSFSQK